jgi:hypothetical protein
MNTKGILTSETRRLSERWNETRKSWRDHKADEFEQTHLAELFERLAPALRSIEELERLLHKIDAECR